MLKINKDEYGDRAVNEANKILNTMARRNNKLAYRLIVTCALAVVFFLILFRLV